jgi:hypothetical protein
VWEDHSSDEIRPPDVRTVPRFEDSWEAFRLLSHQAFMLLNEDDFQRNLDKLEAFVVLWNAGTYVMEGV